MSVCPSVVPFVLYFLSVPYILFPCHSELDFPAGDEDYAFVSAEELDSLSALREQMESRIGDCDAILRECDETLNEAKNLEEKSNKRAMKKYVNWDAILRECDETINKAMNL